MAYQIYFKGEVHPSVFDTEEEANQYAATHLRGEDFRSAVEIVPEGWTPEKKVVVGAPSPLAASTQIVPPAPKTQADLEKSVTPATSAPPFTTSIVDADPFVATKPETSKKK